MEHAVHEIRKRNGVTVPFAAQKIARAIERAFTATRGGIALEEIDALTARVMERVQGRAAVATPTVEEVQNYVEDAIMDRGYFEAPGSSGRRAATSACSSNAR